MKRIFVFLLILFLSICSFAQEDEDRYLDSLSRVYHTLPESDTNKLVAAFTIAYDHYNVDSTVMWADRALPLAEMHKKYYYKARLLGFKCWAYTSKSLYDEAKSYAFKGIMLCDSIGCKSQKAWNFYELGNIYYDIHNYEYSYRFYYGALDIYRELGDDEWCATLYRMIAENDVSQMKYDDAISIYNDALALDTLSDRLYDIAEDYVGIGLAYFSKFENSYPQPDTKLLMEAKKYVQKSINVNCQSLSTQNRISRIMSDVLAAQIMYNKPTGQTLNELADSLRYFCNLQEELSYRRSSLGSIAKSKISKLTALIAIGDMSNAKRLTDSITVALPTDDKLKSNIDKIYSSFIKYYQAAGDYKMALHYQRLHQNVCLDEASVALAVKSAEDYQKVQFDNQIQEREALNRQKRIVLIVFLIVIAIVTFFLVVIYLRQKKYNKNLNSKNTALESQKKQITASINYASLIQKAVMPTHEVLKSMFSDYFLIYKPLHIVAGDFYWAKHIGKYNIVVCADSTGHGVPGAFVSMLGVSLLNEVCPSVVAHNGSPDQILNELRTKLMESLGQSIQLREQGQMINTDGIDMSVLMIDTETSIVKYAGAYRPLWHFSDGQIIQYKPDKMPIGIYFGEMRPFSSIDVNVKPGDTLYMFSDGIVDQFGYTNPEHTEYRHFSIKRFLSLLNELGSQPMDTQKAIVVKTLSDWKNGFNQLDDITVMGLRF